MGNGYPVAAVVTRREIADDFTFARRVFDVRGACSSTNPTGRGQPRDDVLKIRPPLVFSEERVDVLVSTLDAA